MRLIQIWDSEDPVMSDHWCPTLDEANRYLKNAYNVKQNIAFDDGKWSVVAAGGITVFVEQRVFLNNNEAVCNAINEYPKRWISAYS